MSTDSRSGRPRGTPAHRRLRPGDAFEAEVRDLTSRGLGVVAHASGRVFFAAGVWPGEAGRFAITRLRRGGGEARLVELTRPSTQRRAPPCPNHGFSDGDCGGCGWMFMDYGAQLAAKQARVEGAVARISKTPVDAIWPAPTELGYRNRAQLKSDGKRLGFQAAGSHRIVDVTQCPVLDDSNAALLRALRSKLPNAAWRPARRDTWTTLHIDDSLDADTVVADRRLPFRQGNTRQNARMREALAGIVTELGAPSPALELFAGAGNFTEVLASGGCSPITAVDSFEPAVSALTAKGIEAVTARCLALERDDSRAALHDDLARARLLLLDPPRDGFAALPAVVADGPQLDAVIYISCDVATWARDVAGALAAGFELVRVQPLDLFPQTPHVELMSLLRRSPAAQR